MHFLDSIDKAVVFVLVLGALIVFHELGHFLAAKIVGVKVEVFAFGFGPRLFGKRIGETDYRVSLVPLGGYVRMAGEGGEEPASGSEREFESRSSVEKLAIMLAGPLFNAILAIALLTAAYMNGIEEPAFLSQPVVVGRIEPDSPASRAGLRVGDRVAAVDGTPVAAWQPYLELVATSPNATVPFTIERDGQVMDVEVKVAAVSKHASGWVGASPCSPIVVRDVVAGSRAQVAGLAADDEIVSIAGEPPCSVQGFVDALQQRKGTPVPLVLRRGDRTVETTATPLLDATSKRWALGLHLSEPTVFQRHGFRDALATSLVLNAHDSKLLLVSLYKLFTFQLSFRSMSGPLELADITTASAEAGASSLFQMMALISLNLALFNLLPIPLLDGGRIFILLIEAVRGREIERRTKEWILQAGLAMIVALMVVVIFFDVIKKLEG